ncbi:hypothetical protein IFM89_009255 [Coptis chinensis]|uniref:DUF4283 domain-containing protein n=1 Tax=Coptis chinensis TaxID=261450 RepID=A0A835LZR5_9MAGN|nr:hypothetical protein IFM89_009255 [Coptis chinensis]
MIADQNLFYFKFVNDEDRQLVIDHGPLFLAGRIFVVRPWFPALENLRNGITALPIWIKMDLPKHLGTKNGIDFISSIIGEPICMDNATTNRTRITYARVCTIVDTNFKFPSHITVNIGEDTIDIGLDYEWQPEVCDTCKIFGHSTAKCPNNKAKDVQAQDTAKQVQTQHTQVIRYKRQTMRWTPKKYAQNGQTSCLRDDEGAPIPPEGLTKESLVIILEDRAQVPEGTNKENETLDSEGGSHIVVRTGVHAANCFKVLMTNDDDEMKNADDAQFNSLEIVPYVSNSLRKEKELQQEEHFAEVRTGFEFTEVVQVTEEYEEGLPEVDTEEMNAYSIKRSYV